MMSASEIDQSQTVLPSSPTPSSPTSDLSSRSDDFKQVLELEFLKFLPSNQQFLVESRLIHNGAIFKVSRRYEDFALLNANLVSLVEPSTILPPLPDNFEAQEKVLPEDQGLIIKTGGVDHRDCEEFSLFLQAVLRHAKMGTMKVVEDFFIQNNLQLPIPKIDPASTRNSKKTASLMSKFTTTSPSKRLVTQAREIDEFYEKQRFFIISHDAKLQIMKSNFEETLIGNRKLCNVLSHFATSITAALVVKEETGSQMVAFMKSFTSSLENFRVHLDLSANLAYQHLGVILQYLFLYNLTFKEMVAQRGELQSKYESAVRTLQKSAESKNFEKAREEKDRTEKEVEKFSENGRSEVEQFHDFRNTFLVLALHTYKKNQLVMAKKTVSLLRQSIQSLKNL